MASENITNNPNQFLDIEGVKHLLGLINTTYSLKNHIELVETEKNNITYDDLNDYIANFPDRKWIDNDLIVFNKPNDKRSIFIYHSSEWHYIVNETENSGGIIDPSEIEIPIATYKDAGIVKPNESQFMLKDDGGLDISSDFIQTFISQNTVTSIVIGNSEETLTPTDGKIVIPVPDNSVGFAYIEKVKITEIEENEEVTKEITAISKDIKVTAENLVITAVDCGEILEDSEIKVYN